MSKMQSVKNHIKRNKVTYIACAATAVVVGGVTYYVTRTPAATKAATKIVADTAINNAPVMHNVGCLNPVMNNYTITLVDNSNRSKAVGLLGADGLVDRVFNSISEAARELDIDKRRISAVVNGLAETAGGQKFVPLEVAA